MSLAFFFIEDIFSSIIIDFLLFSSLFSSEESLKYQQKESVSEKISEYPGFIQKVSLTYYILGVLKKYSKSSSKLVFFSNSDVFQEENETLFQFFNLQFQMMFFRIFFSYFFTISLIFLAFVFSLYFLILGSFYLS
ncbi:hypothetical protein IMG5_116890 [Ichthyophthirius multifiliis]|uniref:Transmembrane protein n=1 Tax=Ichthyophthirius multifiliis TaxID=5932 RepID=G0QUG3_ICHMU|nr:hypothetical protein IMG5_116890 [Ichthyophthirius multifiliis]EGR31159.1 hypothetical protein IMG5_116890 [Ichthyophthirius multifiliis]|eukprot:XP_004034645.1 hypothetical protein IMG5_116890 [Ichthyophthirius multifiliis]